ncbi:serine/threonine protein phosphatase [Histoplasma capsulatum H143]|uniref:Serine/threonine protein phosphatase n=1 Tax=Ajellomyces capsulatus (strain H143) TaxID=544712 RepID=C6HN85_AJECH|nr:serine/threonine protein phosphatase [Histoplasma capsulatum H143]
MAGSLRSPSCSAHPFQILSDFHLEKSPAYSFFDIPARAPHLALPGDVGNACDSDFFVFIETQLQNFKTVYFLLGNHEPYHSSWKEVRQKADEFAALITVLGCAFYTYITPEQETDVSFGLNDFYCIDGWTVADHNTSHTVELVWLNERVAVLSTSESDRKIVIFTQHIPITDDSRAVDPVHLRKGNGKVKRVLSNQRGYYFKQSHGFNVENVVDVSLHVDRLQFQRSRSTIEHFLAGNLNPAQVSAHHIGSINMRISTVTFKIPTFIRVLPLDMASLKLACHGFSESFCFLLKTAFAVPDKKTPEAEQILGRAGLDICTDQDCVVITIKSRPLLVGHFNLETEDIHISLYPQSQILPNITDITQISHQIISASDQSLLEPKIGYGRDPFLPEHHNVRVPPPYVLWKPAFRTLHGWHENVTFSVPTISIMWRGHLI